MSLSITTLGIIQAEDFGFAGFGPTGDGDTAFGLTVQSPISGCDQAVIWLDVKSGDLPVAIYVHVPLDECEQDSTDNNAFRHYTLEGDMSLPLAWKTLQGFAERLSACDNVSVMDRVLVKQMKFERTT